MLLWLKMNIGTIIVCLVLIAVVALIIYSMIRDKKQGRSSCGGNCGSCSGCAGCKMANNCPSNK